MPNVGKFQRSAYSLAFMDGVSLTIPFYNEEQILDRTLSTIWTLLSGLDRPFELLLGDDGSTDRSYEIAQAFQAQHPNECRLLRNPTNRGRGSILAQAFSKAQMPLVVYVDADLEIGPTYIKKLIEEFEDPKVMVCTGSKVLTPHGEAPRRHRRVATVVLNRLIRTCLNSSITDHQCGLKGYRQSIVHSLLVDAKEVGWAFDTEMLLLAQRKKLVVREIPVSLKQHRPSTVSFLPTVCHFLIKVAQFRMRGLAL